MSNLATFYPVASTGAVGFDWYTTTTSVSASNGEGYLIDCSGGVVTVTLPSSASVGHDMAIIDSSGSSSTNNITIARNGHNIMGVAEDFVIDVDYGAVVFVYSDASVGWSITSAVGIPNNAPSTGDMAVLSKSSSVSQNIGGSDGTTVWWTWDGEIKKDKGFTHSTSTNSERLQVDADGWYDITFIGNAMNTGSGRATLMGCYRINGGSTLRMGTIRGYGRGSSYGNLTFGLNGTTVYLTSGDYIEVGTILETADQTDAINTSGSEINDEEHVLKMVKVG